MFRPIPAISANPGQIQRMPFKFKTGPLLHSTDRSNRDTKIDIHYGMAFLIREVMVLIPAGAVNYGVHLHISSLSASPC